MSSGVATVASAIIGSMSKWERKPADFYPTPSDVTYSLLPHIQGYLPAGSLVWEPACGDGAMARVLEAAGFCVAATDLRQDSGYGIGGIDFIDGGHSVTDVAAIITNPPFKIADKFIEAAVQRAPVVAMLLKSQYWHAARRLALFETHPPAAVLPLTWRPSFLEKERGSSPLMDVIWVVWVRGAQGPTTYTPIRRLRLPPGFLPPETDDLDDLIGGVSDELEDLIG